VSDPVGTARAFVATWVETFNTRQPEHLVPLYAEDALLHGTSQARLYVGRAQIGSYFRGTSTVSLGEQHFITLAEDCVLAVGTYVFHRTHGAQSVVTPARFTFVLRRGGGEWRILHHHSSADPA